MVGMARQGMGLERRMELVARMARPRPLQLSTAMAETRLGLRQGRILAALRPVAALLVAALLVAVLV